MSSAHGERLVWNLTERAIVGLVSLGIMLAIGVGGWSLKMQVSSASEIRELRNTVESAMEQSSLRDQHNRESREQLKDRIISLEQWGPAYGPRVTTKDLDARMESVMGTYAQLYEQLVSTIEKLGDTLNQQTALMARFDERLKRMEGNP